MYYVQTLAIHAFVVPFYAACWLATEKVQQSFNSSLMVSVTQFLRNVRATPANSTTPTEYFSHKKKHFQDKVTGTSYQLGPAEVSRNLQ